MNIINFYKLNLTEILNQPLPEERLSLPSNYKYIESGAKLYEYGKKYNICLNKVDKLKYYLYKVCLKDWNVYVTEVEDYDILLTIKTTGVVLEAVKLVNSNRSRRSINLGEKYYKNIITKQLQETRFQNIEPPRKFTPVNSIEWNSYIFNGYKEDMPVSYIKAVGIDMYEDWIHICITNPDQVKNNLHRWYTAHRIDTNSGVYITDELCLSDDECFKKITMRDGSIHIKDINSDKIVTLDVTGTQTK